MKLKRYVVRLRDTDVTIPVTATSFKQVGLYAKFYRYFELVAVFLEPISVEKSE